MWKQLGLAFLVMAAGLTMSVAGFVGDFYEHEIAGFSPELESIYAPVHLLIFGGIGLTAPGFLIGAFGLRRAGYNPVRMLLTAGAMLPLAMREYAAKEAGTRLHTLGRGRFFRQGLCGDQNLMTRIILQ